MTVELSKHEIQLLIKAITTAQINKEDEVFAFLLANRLKSLVQS